MKHLVVAVEEEEEDNNDDVADLESINQNYRISFLDVLLTKKTFRLKHAYSICCWLVVIIFVAIAYLTKTNYLKHSNNPIVKQTQHCYVCDNYASLSESSGFRPGPGTGLAWFGGKPVVGGWTSMSSNGNQLRGGLTSLQISRLCSERVNRSAIKLLIDSENYGKCENINYDGCAKIVTKSWRVRSQLGVPSLSAVVVSRTCAAIPEGYGVGCFNSVGGAGMRRTICYCRGNFCNHSVKTKEINKYFIILLVSIIATSQ